MKLYDIVKWDPSEDTANEIVAYKHEAEDFNTHTQLIVHQSQEAIFFKDGRALDLFGAGKHTLKADNIPILKKLINLPTGGQTPFHCEVYFVNKVFQMDMKWGTSTPIQTEDPVYGILVNVGASGAFSAQISDTRKFLTKIVGTRQSYTRTELVKFLRAAIVMNVKDVLAKIMNKNRISFLQATTEIKGYSAQIKEELVPIFDEFGIDIVRFDWETLIVPDKDLQPLKDAKNRAAARAIEGYTYQQEQGFEVMRTAAGNQGAGGMMGVGMGLGMGVGMGAPMGNAFGNIAQNTMNNMMGGAQQPQQPAQGSVCPNCNANVPNGAKFCPECGTKLAVKSFCPECGAQLNGAPKFCPECGTKIGG